MKHLSRSAVLAAFLCALSASIVSAAHEPPEINDDYVDVTTKSSGKANTVHVLDNDEPAHPGDELKIVSIFTPGGGDRKLEDEDYSVPPSDLNADEYEIAYAKPGAFSVQDGYCEADGKGQRIKYTPPYPRFEGDDICGYEACDEEGGCGEALVFLTVTAFETASPTTYSPTRMPAAAPELKDDEYDELIGVSNLDVLANDVVDPSRGPLKVMNIIPPPSNWEKIPGPESRRRLEETGFLSPNNGWENIPGEEIAETADEPEIAMVQEGAHSYAGGMCNPTGNRLRVKYTPKPGYSGPDMCEYEACDDNGKGVCGTAMIIIKHAESTETASPMRSPTRSPTMGKSRKKRSSKGSKAGEGGGHHKEKKEERKKARMDKKKKLEAKNIAGIEDTMENDESEPAETQKMKKMKKKIHEDEA